MIICGTGHRPDKLGGYDGETTKRLWSLAYRWLDENRPSKVITGMALGWDQALGWAAHDLGIPFIAAVPFEGQENAWPTNSKLWYRDLLALAEDITVVCDGGYAAWKMQERNKWMVDKADLVLALWNGTDGGTANCIKYANKVGKPITNLWEVYANQP